MSETIETLNIRIQLLESQVKTLEARLNDLCLQPNQSKVAPEGVACSFDVKKNIENIESRVDDRFDTDSKGTYYENWTASNFSEIVISEHFISKQHGDAMFDGFYYVIRKMIHLKKLKIISNNNSDWGSGLSIFAQGLNSFHIWKISRHCNG